MKNLLKFTIISATIFFSNYVQAQSETDEIRSDSSYIAMLEKHIAFQNSDEYKKHMEVFFNFADKVPEDFDFFYFDKYASNFEEWITERIDDSGFESVEDAVNQYKTLAIELEKINHTKNELFKEKKNVKEKFENKELFDKIFAEEMNKKSQKISQK